MTSFTAQFKPTNLKKLLLSLCIVCALPLHAEGPILQVAVVNFVPPFVMRGANNQFFGFDIDMMEYICSAIQRTCHYTPMVFSELLHSLEVRKADVALGAITITAERAARVNFSSPYLPSKSQFLGLQSPDNAMFSLEKLTNQTIGITKGTIFEQQILSLGIIGAKIKEYERIENMLEGLKNGDIKAALVDAPTALYWQNESANTLAVLGSSLSFGYGYGVAVTKQNVFLLQQINAALVQFTAGEAFKSTYNKYLASF